MYASPTQLVRLCTLELFLAVMSGYQVVKAAGHCAGLLYISGVSDWGYSSGVDVITSNGFPTEEALCGSPADSAVKRGKHKHHVHHWLERTLLLYMHV